MFRPVGLDHLVLRVVDLPRPTIGPTEVLVARTHSVVSAGTERAVRRLASSSLLAKARARVGEDRFRVENLLAELGTRTRRLAETEAELA